MQSRDLFSCNDKASKAVLGPKAAPPFVVNKQKLLCEDCMNKFTGEHKEFCPICLRSYLNDRELKAIENAQKQSRGALRPLDDFFPSSAEAPDHAAGPLRPQHQQQQPQGSSLSSPGRLMAPRRTAARSSPFGSSASLRSPGGLEEGAMGDGMVSARTDDYD